MDIRKQPVEDIRATQRDRVVSLRGKKFVSNGTIPMADILVATPRLARRSVRFAFGMSGRFAALLLALLMILLPLSPVFAAEQSVTEDPLLDSTPGEPEASEASEADNAETLPADSDLPPAPDVEDVEDGGEPAGSVDETTEGEGSDPEVEIPPADPDPLTEGDDVEGESEFDPDHLPSADNPVPEGWYDDDGVGEPMTDDAQLTTDEEVVEEDDVIEPPTQEELWEQLRAEVYEEVLTELETQIAAFEEEKRKLQDGCLNYEDGSFFCLDPERSGGPLAPQQGGAGTVYMQQDPQGGDGEIYYLSDQATIPIPLTDDVVDDQFPAIDIAGRAFVWQSFVNDRWQITYRDGATGAVEQLTSTSYNSMHPQVQGDMVVWQGWPASNWEIFLARRQAGGWSVEQITDNAMHDMFPKVAGGFVTWQANDGEDWQVYAYELATGTTHQLSTGAGKHQNPRVALIWETEEDDGSRRILGFDLATGDVEPVGSRPATPDPEELPKPPLTDEEATITEAPAGTEDDVLPDDDTDDGEGNGDGV